MNKRIMNYAAVGAYALGLFGLNSCLKVDDTYDLNKDIDMTITVGGDLTLPGSSTERMLLGDLLELEDDGIVKADETTGDYALVQKGESSTTSINVKKVEIDVSSQGFGQFTNTITLGQSGTINNFEVEFSDKIDVNITKNKIPTEILRLENTITKMGNACLVITQNDGGVRTNLKQGFRIIFPDYIIVKYNGNDNAWSANGNILELTAESYAIDNYSKIPFEISNIRFVNQKSQGTDNENKAVYFYDTNTIKIDGDIKFEGRIFADGTTTGNSLKINGKITADKLSLEKVNGTVKPKNNKNSIEIGELPDFLNGDDVIIDVTDPRIYLTVYNPTDARITMDAKLVSTIGEVNGEEVYINDLIVPANQGNYKICIHQNRNFPVDGYEVIVDNLSSLIERIPNAINIEIQQIVASGNGVTLGEEISIKTDYELNTPLMFGSNTNIKYEEVIDGWTTDLDDAEFETVEVLMTVVNEIPLGLNLQAIAIDQNGNKLDNVNIESNIDIEAGTIENAKTKEVKLAITALDGSIKGMDGIKLIITATASERTAGTALNANQTLKFDDIKLRLKGGVTMDLN